jgi:hypothetical protein
VKGRLDRRPGEVKQKHAENHDANQRPQVEGAAAELKERHSEHASDRFAPAGKLAHHRLLKFGSGWRNP